jgi:GINS complex subunit 3
VPVALSQRVINALKADPKTVELRSQAQHFYNLGARTMELFEGEEMIDVLTDVSARNTSANCLALTCALQKTFKKRAAGIADHAHNARGAMGDGVDFLRGLDETERQLFRVAHDSAKAVKRWMTNDKQTQ